MGKFICFEGLDGSGKTNISNKVYSMLKEQGKEVIFINKKELEGFDPYVSQHMKQIKKILWDYAPDDPLSNLGDEHWLHLNIAWFAVLDYCKIQEELSKDKVVIIDNWYYKLLSRYVLKPQYQKEYIEHSFSKLRVPDKVIYLDVTPSIAAKRRTEYSITETGNMDGFEGNSSENFINYQSKVREVLLNYVKKNNWSIINTDNLNEDQVVSEALQIIELEWIVE
ncbi:hypothetical protein HCA69_10040 [Listeria grandensis]|uniref:Thymidylate kinase n=1 Tax=Listeria grandensis TaxID=1494963 RepID=A0A7X0Y5A6_9LIST|nr:hypothetical protein [Listeria grandensis]MBC1936707.1 hypothetical protein [Listeria grandensis]